MIDERLHPLPERQRFPQHLRRKMPAVPLTRRDGEDFKAAGMSAPAEGGLQPADTAVTVRRIQFGGFSNFDIHISPPE